MNQTPRDMSTMESDITTLLDLANLGRVYNDSFLSGIIACLEAIDREQGPLESHDGSTLPTGVSERPYEATRLPVEAIKAFASLTRRITNKEISGHAFLNTEFYVSTTKGGSNLSTVARGLMSGLEGLVRMLRGISSSKPLLRWANIAIAANFLLSPQNASGTRTETETLAPPQYIQSASISRSLQNNEKTISEEFTEVGQSKHEEMVTNGEDDIGHCALGLAIEQYYGVRHDLQEPKEVPGYKRALANWRVLLASIALRNARHKEFLRNLSPAQKLAAKLLVEWWFDDVGIGQNTIEAFAALGRASETGLLDGDAFKLFKVSEAAASDPKRQSLLQQLIFDSEAPPYHAFMFRLFQQEFLPVHYLETWTRKALNLERRKAAKFAACQRLSMNLFRSVTASCNDESLTGDSNMPSSSLSTSPGGHSAFVPQSTSIDVAESSSKPSTLDTLPILMERTHFSEIELERLREFIRPSSAPTLGASFLPCEWLNSTATDNDLPHYLWDIANERTVVTRDLGSSIEYTAISHTWGRWKYHDNQKHPKVRLPGLQEWTIPQNSKFKVEHIPDILAAVPFQTQYIWLDLVCIPQEPEHDQLVLLSQQEIGRQAKIFRSAKFTVA
jgi:hypothetical protein